MSGGSPPTRTLTIVLPAFNEEHRLSATLADLASWRSGDGFDVTTVIVCDDGSTDDTAAIVSRAAATDDRLRLLSTATNEGKGAALRRGLLASSTDLVAFVDADLPVPFRSIEAMVDRLGDADLVVGSRRHPGSSLRPPQPMLRRAGSRLFRTLLSALAFDVTTDPHCGVKVLRRAELADVIAGCVSPRFAFDTEMIVSARSAGLRVVDAPVEWRHVDGSTLRPVRDGVRTIVDLVARRRELARRT